MAEREYELELPYTIQFQYIGIVISEAKRQGIYNQLPDDLKTRLEDGKNNWSHVELTKEDLDSLDDETWEKVKQNLKYIT